ncbi:hypothetical protein D3C81_1923520 [compost metagenome]
MPGPQPLHLVRVAPAQGVRPAHHDRQQNAAAEDAGIGRIAQAGDQEIADLQVVQDRQLEAQVEEVA